MSEKEPQRGRYSIVGTEAVSGFYGRVRAGIVQWDPEAPSLSDALAEEMMKDPVLKDLVRRQRPDLFPDNEIRDEI